MVYDPDAQQWVQPTMLGRNEPHPDGADEARERAAEAWHGGQVLRDHLGRLGTSTDMDHVAYWARKLAAGTVVERYGVMRDAVQPS